MSNPDPQHQKAAGQLRHHSRVFSGAFRGSRSCPVSSPTEKRSAGHFKDGSQFKPREEEEEEAGGHCAVSDVWAGASSSPPSLHRSCSPRTNAYTARARAALRHAHAPDYPEGGCTLLTFASVRRVLAWLINLAQSDFEQWELPKYSSLVEL